MMRAKLLISLIPVLGVQLLLAQVPQTISYQGVLTDAAVPMDGSTDMTFRLWNAKTGGTALWTELHLIATTNSVSVTDGLFDVILGQMTALPDPFPSPAWLGVSGPDGVEMTPRIELTSVPYSLNAGSVAGADNLFPSSGNVGIGTTPPEFKLHIVSSDQSGIAIKDSITGTYRATLINWETAGGQLNLNDAAGTIQAVIRGYEVGGVQATFMAGNVGIGTATPTEVLEVVGGVKADSLILPLTTRYYAIPASGFFPAADSIRIESQPFAIRGASLSDTGMFIMNYVKLNAPVHLPHGATITEFQVGMTDESSLDITANLYMVSGNSNSPSLIAPLSSTGNSATFNVSYIGLSQVVDNQNYTYMIWVEWTMPDVDWGLVTDLQLRNARITYTVTSPLP